MLLILAGVVLNTVLGNDGIIAKAQLAKENQNYADAEESLQLLLMEIKTEILTEEKRDTQITDCDKLQGKQDVNKVEYVDEEIAGKTIKYANITYRNYVFKVNDKLEIIENLKIEEDSKENTYNSLIDAIDKITKSGIQDINVNNKIYSIDMIIQTGNITLDGKKQINGSTLINNIYEFGNKEEDVAKLGEDQVTIEDAKNMVVLKVNGNLTISQDVTLTACKSDSGYGGPKGLLIYCTGTLTNNGTIDMTARGARAVGEDVFLWKNSNNEYEYVPAEGASKSDEYTWGKNAIATGTTGKSGEGRQTRWRRCWRSNPWRFKWI